MAFYSTLFAPLRQFAAAAPAAPLFEDLAPITGGRDITRGLVDSLPLLPPLDSLAGRDGGLPLDVYRKVYDDPQVKSALEQRRNAVVSTEWEVIPGGASRKDKKAAELITRLIGEALPWDQITAKMHQGVFLGSAYAECLWMRDGTDVIPEAICVRDAARFGYRPSGELALLTVGNPFGEVLPERKFWVFRTGATHDDDPYGMGLAHWCYWPVQFKLGTVKLWLIALDKYASPTALGKFRPGGTEAQQRDERAKLLAALNAIRHSTSIAIPEGMSVELLSASRSGAADYVGSATYWDQMISKVILGHGAGADATPGRLGGETNASDVRGDLVAADADLINASGNLSWVRWVTEWSIPGAIPPRIWRRTVEDDDLNGRAEREARIFTLGYRPTLAQIKDTYGGEWEVVASTSAPDPAPVAPTQGIDAAGRPDPAMDTIPANLAAPAPEVDPIAEPLDRLGREAAPMVDSLLAAIRAELDAAPDLDNFNARLLTLYPELAQADLTELLGQAFLAAELMGRAEVADETGGPT